MPIENLVGICRVPVYTLPYTTAHDNMAIRKTKPYCTERILTVRPQDDPRLLFFLFAFFPPSPVCKTSKITRMKAVMP